MKTIFKVFGLKEQDITLDAWLNSNGIETERECITFRIHLIDFDNKLEAIEFIKNCEENFEHGFEIIETITKS